MSARPFVDPDTGALYLSVDAWAVLVRAATAQESEPPASETAAATDLAEAGILVDGEVDPRIAPHLRAVTRATAVMALAGSDSRVDGWLGADGMTIARPHDASTLEVVWAPIPLLPEVLTRLTGLGPRPRGAEAPVRTTAGELAAVVAKMDSPTPTTGAAGASLGELHDYWALDISAGGDAGLVRRVEVLDSEVGLAGRARRAGGDPEPRDIDPGVAAPRGADPGDRGRSLSRFC